MSGTANPRGSLYLVLVLHLQFKVFEKNSKYHKSRVVMPELLHTCPLKARNHLASNKNCWNQFWEQTTSTRNTRPRTEQKALKWSKRVAFSVTNKCPLSSSDCTRVSHALWQPALLYAVSITSLWPNVEDEEGGGRGESRGQGGWGGWHFGGPTKSWPRAIHTLSESVSPTANQRAAREKPVAAMEGVLHRAQPPPLRPANRRRAAVQKKKKKERERGGWGGISGTKMRGGWGVGETQGRV